MTQVTVKDTISTQEAAMILGVGASVIQRLIDTGALRSFRYRKRWVRVLRAQVNELRELDRDILRNA